VTQDKGQEEQSAEQTEAAAGPLYLLHDATLDVDALKEEVGETVFAPVTWAERDAIPDGARVVLCLNDEQVREVALLAVERGWEVGLLPHGEALHATTTLGVKGKIPDLLRHYGASQAIEADVLTCNGEVAFSSVVIGRVLSLRPYDINRPQTRWSFFTGSLKGMGKLRLRQFRLTTAKDRTIRLAAIGLLALNHTRSALLGRIFSDDLSIADGRLSLLALAPRSVSGYLLFMLRLMLPRKVSLSRLPNSVALLQSNRILLEAPRGCEYLLDGKPVHGNQIELLVLDRRLKILPGPALTAARADEPVAKEKETVRLNHVPVDDAALAMTDKHLPLFSHATEQEYRELFRSLRDSASATASYQVLMVLSTLLALTGLYANSAPVIIGAMILAPLMSPIVSLAMGLARTESNLIRQSTRTLAIGVGWGLGFAVLFALLMPLDIPTAEMRARMSPNLLDLMVAVISGIAGAYAHAKEEIAKSLAGVAIAVALVPPLAVAGIGLGWADWDMARGALLLLTTNLVGIALAASLTFLVLGFAPFSRARAGVGFTLAIMLVIAAPLSVAFAELVERNRITDQVPAGEIHLDGLPVEVSQRRVTLGDPHLVRVVLSSPERLDNTHVDQLKRLISERVGEPVLLEAQINIRR
jgi:uncharacterized hydrophobic protein (TIGR00271 family)